ncbi:MAG: 50S ribosomal protein L13 [Candidatus Moranbacteria bacterium]|nr:50S ribosomal protein L13 [Candidatus Moranbacteria bacterium]
MNKDKKIQKTKKKPNQRNISVKTNNAKLNNVKSEKDRADKKTLQNQRKEKIKEKQAEKSKIKKNQNKKATLVRQIHKIDLQGKIFGRAAGEVALLLAGKRKVEFEYNQDKGDYVHVFNLQKIKLSGNYKEEKKKYYWYTGYPGGIREITFKKAKQKDFPKIFKKAVYRMLPKNKLRKGMINRLKIDSQEITS